jgi:hypothetical protein
MEAEPSATVSISPKRCAFQPRIRRSSKTVTPVIETEEGDVENDGEAIVDRRSRGTTFRVAR